MRAANVLPSLLLMLGSLLTIPTLVSAHDLLQLVVYAENAPVGALERAKADSSIFMNKFISQEGSLYKSLEPGESLGVRTLTLLRGAGGGGSEMKETHQHRELPGSCPPSCSNSGSASCANLGCAYCGRCSRRLQEGSNRQRLIEASIDRELLPYCQGQAGCTIKAKILRVNDDGTKTLAT